MYRLSGWLHLSFHYISHCHSLLQRHVQHRLSSDMHRLSRRVLLPLHLSEQSRALLGGVLFNWIIGCLHQVHRWVLLYVSSVRPCRLCHWLVQPRWRCGMHSVSCWLLLRVSSKCPH